MATKAIDYEALAREFGGSVETAAPPPAPQVSSKSAKPVDYAAMAKEFGGSIESPPQAVASTHRSFNGTEAGIPGIPKPIPAALAGAPDPIPLGARLRERSISPTPVAIEAMGDPQFREYMAHDWSGYADLIPDATDPKDAVLKGFAKAAAGTLTPKNLATLITAEFGVGALRGILGSSKLAGLLSKFPKVREGLDVFSTAAIPAAFAGASGAAAGKAGYEAVTAKDSTKAIEKAIESLVDAAFAGLGAFGVAKSVKGVRSQFPTKAQSVGPFTKAAEVTGLKPEQVPATGSQRATAAATAEALEAGGANLAAQSWKNIARDTLNKPMGVEIGGQPHSIVTKYVGADGTISDKPFVLHKKNAAGNDVLKPARANTQVFNEDGTIVYTGTPADVYGWLGQRGVSRVNPEGGGALEVGAGVVEPAALPTRTSIGKVRFKGTGMNIPSVRDLPAARPAATPAASPAAITPVVVGDAFGDDSKQYVVEDVRDGKVRFKGTTPSGEFSGTVPVAAFDKIRARYVAAPSDEEKVEKPIEGLGAAPEIAETPALSAPVDYAKLAEEFGGVVAAPAAETTVAAEPEPAEPGAAIPDIRAQRVVEARERLAQEMTGKPWAELANTERLAIEETDPNEYSLKPVAEPAIAAAAAEVRQEPLSEPAPVLPVKEVIQKPPAAVPEQAGAALPEPMPEPARRWTTNPEEGANSQLIATPLAKPAETRKFSSTQVNLPAPVAAAVQAEASKISNEDLADKGRETEPHVTVKFGLHGNDAEAVREVLVDESPVVVKLGKTSVFKDDGTRGSDVVKVDVESPDLTRLNKKIADAVEHTDTQPGYEPHVTLAYVKPGSGEKYAGANDLEGQEITVDKITFAGKDGEKVEIPLTGKAESVPEEPVSAQPAAILKFLKSAVEKIGRERAREIQDALLKEDGITARGKLMIRDKQPMKSFEVARWTAQRLKPAIMAEAEKAETPAKAEESTPAASDEAPFDLIGTVKFPDGMESVVRKYKDDYRVILRDTDADKIVDVRVFPLSEFPNDTEAIEYAKTVADNRGGEWAPATPVAKSEETSTVKAGTTSEPDATAGENPAALAEVPPEDVRGTHEVSQPRAEREESGRTDEGSDGGTRGEGPSARPSQGTGERGVGVPATRGQRNSSPAATDYRITPDDRIGEGSIKQKAADNIEAIRTLKRIEAEARPATPEEQKVLVKYVGWGGMPQPFQESYAVPREWQGLRAEMDAVFTPEEFASARASTPNAHYTSPMVIEGIWNAVKRLGGLPEGGGRIDIIEPSMGVGHFFGMMPANDRVERVGVELDSITGRIARLLYPKADIHVAGFEKVRVPNDYFDLAISNVPFGNYGIHDPAFKRTPQVTKSIHDYFFAKAIEKVRPGGLVVFITSNFTMDKRDSSVRKYLSDRADLVGAIRLPNSAFKGNAGTEVTTDIIILQKRATQTSRAGESWAELSTITGPRKRPDGSRGEGELEVNEYYARHPEMMLGEMGLEGSMYRDSSPALVGNLTPEKLQAAVGRLPENVVKPWEAPRDSFDSIQSIPNSGDIKEGGFAVKDGKVVVRHGDQLKAADVTPEQVRRIKGMIAVRDAVREVFRTQIQDAPEAEIAIARRKLGQQYDVFTRVNGALHSRPNVRAFADDPDAPLLLSLENWDPETKTAKKAAVFTERTIDRYRPADKADSASDALSISLNEKGRIDWARMQALTGRTPDELRDELGTLVYQNPAGKMWEPADEYLSGNVRQKLNDAEAAARTNPKLQRNVDALRAVQPKDLEAEEINGRLGASWIAKDDVGDFVAELLELPRSSVRVSHSEALASWSLTLGRKDTVANVKTYGTSRYWGSDLIEDALNLRNPTVYDTVGDKSVLNEPETLAAREMQQQIKENFAEWIWKDPTRASRLKEAYNNEFNSDRLWQPDGSHLNFPGMAAGLTLRPHQKNAVWRIVRGDGNVLLAHVVGAGKTLEIVAGAMEQRRLGRSRKPMIVVPKNRVDGTAEEFLRAYPSANILVMSSEDFTKGNRQKMMARIATGNWDSVIVSYESFEKLPVSDDTFNGYLQDQIDDLEAYIREAQSDKADARLVKELEKSKKRLEAKLRGKADRESKDAGISFEELGVDSLFVDEADNFKNLFFPTKMTRIAGIPNTESKRAFDMFIKTQHVAKMNNGRGIVFATGTPIANTMAEMWTMQRFLQPQYLRDHGMQHFDAWAQTFGEVRPTLEVSPDGSGYRMTNRFSKFVNIPELVKGFRQMADVQTADMLKLPVPSVKGGGAKTISAPASPEQKAFLQDLARRSKDIRDRKVNPKVDNMLKVSTDGRKAALDIRLVNPDAEDFASSKVNKAVDNIVRIWKETEAKKLTQLVFLDFSKPADPGERKFSVSDDLKAKLIARGIPANEVAFIHEGDTDAARELLFQKVNDGRVRVMIGSTQKMGVGVNVQRLQKAQHHLDAPWRPRDIEQREGRGIRQGNTNSEIEIYRYVTEPSFDAKMWDTLNTKALFIGQVMRGDVSVREAEDVSDVAVSFAEVAAIASGNPAIREKTVIDAEVRKFDALRSRHEQQAASVRRELQAIPQSIARFKEHLAKVEADIATRDANPAEYTIGKTTFKGDDARKKAGESLQKRLESLRGDESIAVVNQSGKPFVLGSYRGLRLEALYPMFELKEESIPLPTVRIVGDLSYQASTNQYGDAGGTLQSIESKVRGLDSIRDAQVRRIADAEKQLADTKAIAGQKFEQADKLKDLLAKQRELAKQLQAPAVEAVGPEDDDANDHPEDLNDLQAIRVGSDKKQPLSTVGEGRPSPEKGLPFSDYKVGQGRIAAPDEGWSTSEVDGKPVYTNGLLALFGEPPSSKIGRRGPSVALGKIFTPIDNAIPIQPVAFSKTNLNGEDATLVWFTNGAVVNAKLYDHIVRQLPTGAFVQGADKHKIQFIVDGKTAGVVMPIQGVDVPANVTRILGERGAAPILTDIAQWIHDKFKDDAPKVNYSGLGALESKFMRNLSQTEKRSSKAFVAAIRAASSRAQSATILRAAVPSINKALKGSDFGWQELRLALIESRLRGLRDRWLNFADQADSMSDDQLAESYEPLSGLLEAIEGKRNLPQDITQAAAAIVEAEDWGTLRDFLSSTFHDAAAAVTTVMEPEWYDAVTSDPHVQDALAIYKNLVEKPLAENHALNEGIFSNALGPLDTYYPLISIDREAVSGPGRRLPYHKPRNIANNFATGLSEGYSATMEDLRDRLGAAVRSNDKAGLLNVLEQEGLFHSASRDEKTFNDPVTGLTYEGERVEVSAGKQLIKDGKVIYLPARVGVMPKWLARELRPILEGQRMESSTIIDRIIRGLNWFSLAGPADFVFHTANLMGALVANTPFLENSIGGKLTSSTPFLKKFQAMYRVWRTDTTTEDAAADLIEMAKIGVIPDKYASVTFSKRSAEELGAEQKRFTMGPLLYGPSGIDIRSRLLMYRLMKSINPSAKPGELHHFVNQLGSYVPALQSEVERALKNSGFFAGAAPFITAGKTMIVNGINAWTGAGPVPKSGLSMRLWQQLTGGAIVTLAWWALTHHQMTGKWPWDDKRAKLFQIPASDKMRRTDIGKALWGEGPETGYLNFGFFNPLAARGARAMGLTGAFETRQLGGSGGQMFEAAQKDAMNSFAHPALGPVPRGVFVGLTGEEPYVTSLRDRRGQIGVSFFPAIPPRTKPGLPSAATRAFAAIAEMNSFYGDAGKALGESTGMLGPHKGEKGNKYLRMVVDLALPGLVGRASNPYKRAEGLRNQRAGQRAATK